MKKNFCIIILTVIIASNTYSQEEDSEIKLRPTPPPISYLNFFKDTKNYDFDFMYMNLKLPDTLGIDESIVGMGFNYSAAKGYANGFGGITDISFFRLSVPMINPFSSETKKFPTLGLGVGVAFVLDILKGEKKDIAGEIIKKSITLAIFTGGNMNAAYMKYTMPVYNEDEMEMTSIYLVYSIPMGVVADIPLGFYLSLIPFGRYSLSQTVVQSSYSIGDFEGSAKVDYSEKWLDYGMDIDLRPFRNAPEWKISVGAVLSQVEEISKGNLMLTFSIKYEKGKHYSSTTFGPKVH